MDNLIYLQKWIEDYLVKKYGFIDEIWLYGSYTGKCSTYLSDMDLLVVVEDGYFEKENVIKLKAETLGYEYPDLDIHCLKHTDFEGNGDLYVKSVKRGGRVLWRKIITNSQKMTTTA